MARKDEHDEDGDSTEASHGPQECMPCRGSGRVISNLGGKASKITCPWCQGQGTRQMAVDAQARWAEAEGSDAQAGEAASADAAA
jgi:DnaJ-class molecular chaperone